MKKVAILLFLIWAPMACSQSDYNTKRGFVAEGYDVVAYFDGKALEGNKEFSVEHDGVKFKFASEANKDKFLTNLSKYLPQYGGFCAYAIAKSGKKVSVNPETYEIRDGKLYLFYNSGKTNTLKLWLDEAPTELQVKADQNWQKIKNK